MKRVLCDESPLALSEEKGVLSGKYWARYRIPDRPVSPEVQFRVSSGHQRSYRAARSVSENKAVDPYRHPVRLFCRFQHTGRKLPVPQVHPSNPRNSSVTQGESFAGSHKSPTPFVKEQPHASERRFSGGWRYGLGECHPFRRQHGANGGGPIEDPMVERKLPNDSCFTVRCLPVCNSVVPAN